MSRFRSIQVVLRRHFHRLWSVAALVWLPCSLSTGCGAGADPPEARSKVLHYPLRAKIGTLDPVRGATQYSNMATAAIFERLVDYRYPRRPYELTPSLLERMPEVSADGLTYTFHLKKGVRFQDDPCFTATGGRGRELVTEDVFYSLKRMCDPHWSPTGYWLYEGRIEGLDDYRAAERERKRRMESEGRGGEFRWDYDRPVSGLVKLDDHTFCIVLTERFPQFLYVLAMNYASIVPREAVEYYDHEFGLHPVGTGPYRVKEFRRGSWLTLERNPTYRDSRFPTDLDERDRALGLGAYAGRRTPLIDEIKLEIFEQDQPMWLKFRRGDLDVVQVPAEYWPTVFTPDGDPRPWLEKERIHHHALPLLDLIYWGFNMTDPFWGVPPRSKKIRQALSYAVDLEARNQAFYNGRNILYQGPIPPGLDGYEPGYRAQDLDRARALLAQAGFPDGAGLPPLHYETSRSSNSKEQAEMLARQLAAVGVKLVTNLNSFPELDDKLKKRKAQFFGLAWGADYPDAENFLQLFYGPNASPGSNNFNFSNAEYDSLFELAKTLMPSPERTAIYRRLREIVIEETPMIGSMARTRYYLWHDRVKNYWPEEVYYSWWKYLDVEPESP